MDSSLLLSLKTGTLLAGESNGRVSVQSQRGAIELETRTAGLRDALQTLASSRATEDELVQRLVEQDGLDSLAHLYYYLEQLKMLGLLSYSVPAGSGCLLALEPVSPQFRLSPPDIDMDQTLVLSRFAYCRRIEQALALESPLSGARAILPGPAGALLLAELARPQSCNRLVESLEGEGIAGEAVRQAVRLLAAAKLICASGDRGTTEDEDPRLVQWEFHDLLFHARSRSGGIDTAAGATYRFRNVTPPAPALKERMSGEVIPLFQPALDRLMNDDMPLTRAVEERVSVREHGDPPITSEQLGEFLFRTARVRSTEELGSSNRRPYETTSRPYPGGGAAYELEIYPIVSKCSGLEPGLYHYDPAGHQLSRIAAPSAQTAALLRGAAAATGLDNEPQVLLGLAARFQRLTWKYETMAYAALLKDVGVLYQTMYLVANAMGLAPCAIGSGDSHLLANAAGLRYIEESAVGEFMLGSRP